MHAQLWFVQMNLWVEVLWLECYQSNQQYSEIKKAVHEEPCKDVSSVQHSITNVNIDAPNVGSPIS